MLLTFRILGDAFPISSFLLDLGVSRMAGLLISDRGVGVLSSCRFLFDCIGVRSTRSIGPSVAGSLCFAPGNDDNCLNSTSLSAFNLSTFVSMSNSILFNLLSLLTQK